MKNKKGFTLIELLSVIGILAILAIVAVPKVLALFNEAKKNTFKVETQSLLSAVKKGYAERLMSSEEVTETTYSYANGELTKTGNINMYLSGKQIKDGTIKIYKDGKVEFAVSDGTYCAIKGKDVENVTIEETSESCALEIEQFTFNIATNTITAYNGSDAVVVIPSSIDGVAVTKIGNNAFQNKGITSLTIPEGITEIGDYAFANNSLTTLNTPSSVVLYGIGAFANNSLTSINLDTPTIFCCGCISIGAEAFRYNRILQGNAHIDIYTTVYDIPTGINAFANNGVAGQTTITLITNSNGGTPEKC